MRKASSQQSGFTIVELLVVIVVIGVLAAIALVSFSGISQRALVASLQSDLSNSAQLIKTFGATNGTYPVSVTDCPNPAFNNVCLRLSGDNQVESYSRPTADTFILVIKNGTISYQITDDSAPQLSPVFATGGAITTSNGRRVHTFTSDATITAGTGGTIEVTLNGAGGGGGRSDSGGGELPGQSGDRVVTTLTVVSGESFTITVGQYGRVSVTEDTTGGASGAGYTAGLVGGSGSSGVGPCGYGFAFGGGGGGGSTGIRKGATRLAEAKGGSGGTSADGYMECEGDSDSWTGGIGGPGGGSDFPSLTTAFGGGGGGAVGGNGDNGSAVISYPYSG